MPNAEEVSLNVREQYEESPYPRWVQSTCHYNQILERTQQTQPKDKRQKPNNSAKTRYTYSRLWKWPTFDQCVKRYTDCEVVAIDLSLSSLAYASGRQMSWLATISLIYRRYFRLRNY